VIVETQKGLLETAAVIVEAQKGLLEKVYG